MTERQVRNTARPTYGGRTISRPPRRRGSRRVGNPFGAKSKRFLILAVVIIAALLIIKQIFAIKNVVVVAPSRSVEIQTAATKSISGSWTQDNLLTFNSDTLAAKLRKSDPMINKITVNRKWPNSITLNVTLNNPSIVWSSGNQSYVVDADGTAIGRLTEPSKLPLVVDGSNLPVTIGKQVASSKFVAFVQSAVPALTSIGVNVKQMQVKDTTLDLYVVTDKGYKIIIDTSRPINDSVSDLSKVLTSLATQKKTPVEYIDLRIPGKAYYK